MRVRRAPPRRQSTIVSVTTPVPRALTLDLDDTLWPVQPALERADQAIDAWLQQHYPEMAQTWPVAALRELRAQVAAERRGPGARLHPATAADAGARLRQ